MKQKLVVCIGLLNSQVGWGWCWVGYYSGLSMCTQYVSTAIRGKWKVIFFGKRRAHLSVCAKANWCKSKLGLQLYHDLWFLRITGTKRDFADLEDDEEELYPSKKVFHSLQSPVSLLRNSALLLQIQTGNWIVVDLHGCVTMLLSCILLQ